MPKYSCSGRSAGASGHSIYGRALDIRLGTRLAEARLAARATQRGGVGWYPHSGLVHIDTGPVRNWDLDEDGLGLFFNGQRLRFNDKERSATRVRSGHFLPEMDRSGRLLPGLEDGGGPLPGMAYSGRVPPDMTCGRRPL
jgi:hypothetical protein